MGTDEGAADEDVFIVGIIPQAFEKSFPISTPAPSVAALANRVPAPNSFEKTRQCAPSVPATGLLLQTPDVRPGSVALPGRCGTTRSRTHHSVPGDPSTLTLIQPAV